MAALGYPSGNFLAHTINHQTISDRRTWFLSAPQNIPGRNGFIDSNLGNMATTPRKLSKTNMTNVKLEKSTLVSIGGYQEVPGTSSFKYSGRQPCTVFGGGGGIRFVDNDVHETHVAKWNSQFLQEQWTYLSKRHALFFCHAYFFPCIWNHPHIHAKSEVTRTP